MSDLSVAAASELSQQQVQQQIAYAVLAKQLSAAKQQGAAANQLIEAAAHIGKAVGKGQALDVAG